MLALEATLQPQIVERDVDYDQDVVHFFSKGKNP